jgi:subtilisin
VLLVGVLPAEALARTTDVRQWIVQLRDDASVSAAVGRARDRHGVRAERTFQRVLRGYSARMTPAQRDALLADPNVLAVVPDETVQLESQVVPPGISRVGANPSALRAMDGSDPQLDVDIAIVDTGIASHPDLRIAGGYNCTTDDTAAWGDEHSHGTHVAGAAAARDNGIGVVGVAPGARVWSVKVMDASGGGFVSWLVCGIDWVIAQRDPVDPSLPLFEVANMSLSVFASDDGNCGQTGSPTAYDLLHRAVCRLNRAGVTNVVAAGNYSENAANRAPAAYGEVITVGAICDSDGQSGARGPACTAGSPDDGWASFSNFGPALDLVAPGVQIWSTMPGNGYGFKSGTSLATPHVAGAAALYYLLERDAGRPRPTPEDVRAALVSTASSTWRRETYPQGAAKAPPLLDASQLAPGAGFRIGATPGSRLGLSGQQVFFDVWTGRTGGHTGAVELSVSGLPSGASWSVTGSPTVAADGDSWRRITISLPPGGTAGTFNLTVTGTSSGMANQSAAVTLVFDAFVAGSIPRLNLRPVVVPGVALPALVKWTRITNATQYELQMSRDGAPWSLVVRKKGLKQQLDIWPSATYRFRVRALVGGQWRAWRTSYAYVATPEMGNDTHAVLTGSWQVQTIKNAYSEKTSYSTQAGASARLEFHGRSVSWIASRGPTRGRARVYIDGRLVTTIDLYAASVQHRRTVYRKSWANPGQHRIEIVVVGTAGRPRVDVDALVYISAE